MHMHHMMDSGKSIGTYDRNKKHRPNTSIDWSDGVVLRERVVGRIEIDRELGPILRVDDFIQPQTH